jgi:hypothetical protein
MRVVEIHYICKDYIDVDEYQKIPEDMSLIGMFCARIVQLITKYNFDISIEVFERNNTRLIN